MASEVSCKQAGVKIDAAAGGSGNDQRDLLSGGVGGATRDACAGRQNRSRDDESKNPMHAPPLRLMPERQIAPRFRGSGVS